MATPPPGPPRPPRSPDELDGGFRGRVSGVTRIGPRAFGLAFFVICALLVAILYGLNHGSTYSKNQQEAFASPPPAPPSNEPHFGQNVPIVATAAPATPAPLLLPATPVPDLDNAGAHTESPSQVAPQVPAAVAPATESPQDVERDAEIKKRRELLAAALGSAILTNGSSNGPQNGTGSGAGTGATQLSFAGNGSGENANSVASSAGSGTVGGSTALVGSGTTQQSRDTSNSYLDGPTGQYKIAAANVVLPEGGNPKDFLQAQRFNPISPYEITASSVIPAALISGIDSELEGVLSATVREDVYDTKTGRYLLIPRGSRLVGVYKAGAQYGQTRIFVAWQRLIFPDTTSIDLLNMPSSDVQGGAGVAGEVDNHYGKIFGAALLTSILAAGLQLSQPQQSSVFGAPSAGQVAGQAVGQEIAQVGTQLLQKDLNIPPTLHIPHGYPFLVVVDRDIVLPGTYRPQ